MIVRHLCAIEVVQGEDRVGRVVGAAVAEGERVRAAGGEREAVSVTEAGVDSVRVPHPSIGGRAHVVVEHRTGSACRRRNRVSLVGQGVIEFSGGGRIRYFHVVFVPIRVRRSEHEVRAPVRAAIVVVHRLLDAREIVNGQDGIARRAPAALAGAERVGPAIFEGELVEITTAFSEPARVRGPCRGRLGH